jgi:outer membrane lipoprotein-sorting protein
MLRTLAAGCLSVAVFALAPVGTVSAEQPQSTAIGVGTWSSTVKADGEPVGRTFSDEDMAAIQRVSRYFNELKTLQGRFVQVDANQKTSRGKVFVSKPGKFRFEYGRPSRKVVISDGRFLAIQDRDLQTDETYELTDTPFRMLLADDVNLLRDAEVLEIDRKPTQISLVMRDRNPDSNGAIKVVVALDGDATTLQGWITRDAQGLETKVELQKVSHGVELADKLFVREKLFMNKIR